MRACCGEGSKECRLGPAFPPLHVSGKKECKKSQKRKDGLPRIRGQCSKSSHHKGLVKITCMLYPRSQGR